MSKRLASFAGPSSPLKSPTPKSPSSPRQQKDAEPPFHRRVRAALYEIRTVALVWDDLVLRDGLDAAKSLVDTRTDLTNTLASYPDGTLPQTAIIGPRLARMDKATTALKDVLVKLNKCFRKLTSVVDSLEEIHKDAITQRGLAFTTEPLWFTWSLNSFCNRLPSLTKYYHRSLHRHTLLFSTLNDDNLPFEKARSAIQEWATQPDLAEGGWRARWEDVCAAEIPRWSK